MEEKERKESLETVSTFRLTSSPETISLAMWAESFHVRQDG